jgi:hypothetical protein
MLAVVDQGRASRAALTTARQTGACTLVDHAPSEAQKAAGNYRKEHISFQGLPISIENKKGSERSGVGPSGRRWSCVLPADYGYIKGTEGADGDQVDVYLGPDPNAKTVFIVNQHDLGGGFDEHKCLLGFDSEREAVETYCRAFSDGKGRRRIGSVETVSMDAFKRWLASRKTKSRASATQIIDRALKLVRRPQETTR